MELSRLCVLASWLAALTSAGRPRCPRAGDCREAGVAIDEYFFLVKGERLTINFDLQHLSFTCRKDLQLDSDSLPRLATLTVVSLVTLTECAAPASGFAAALLTLNVTVRGALILEDTPAVPTLTAAHLHGLDLSAFVLNAPPAPAPHLQPEQNFFEPLGALLDMRLSRVTVSSEAAHRLPVGLRALTLEHAGLAALPAEMFGRLPELANLTIVDGALRELDVSAAPALRVVDVTAPIHGITLGPSVETATLKKLRSAELRGNCSRLQSLRVEELNLPPPPGWLARCGVLELHLRLLSPGVLGGTELSGARDLQWLEAYGCGLRTLPPDWIINSTHLKTLDLSENELESIPSEVITSSLQLSKIILSGNRLKASSVTALASAKLTDLVLDENPLGDLCNGDGDTDSGYKTDDVSALWDERSLSNLSLRSTGITRVCPDWRQLPHLDRLNLRDNNVTNLEAADLQWSGVGTRVDLRGNPVQHVSYSREHYRRARLAAPARVSPPAQLLLDSGLLCDCRDYWFAKALREAVVRPTVRTAMCADERLLADVPLDQLLCDVPAHSPGDNDTSGSKPCPERCRCAVDGERSHVSCPDAGLTALPSVPLLPPATLLLQRNRIAAVDPAELPAELRLLDLTDNLIEHVDGAAAAALFAGGRRVLLDGNPLACECRDLALQRELAERAAAGEAGRARRRCRERAEAKCAAALWAAPAAALALGALALGAYLARPAARRRLKVFLFERGLCARWALGAAADAAAEAAREYDAFVSFSHHDAEFAARLAERLERGPRARRLCLHERDWTPGEWIPEQIASSVRRSRRTVALVSDSFLASPWARAELREAYGAALREGRARLLAVLLPGMEAPRAAAAPELRAYLAAVTYLRWDDPRFWDKLLLAVPPPPAPRPPPPP